LSEEDTELNKLKLAAVPTILEVVCRTSGMGFAAVARVTETRWIAYDVRDEIGFGLKSGGELELETTICREVRNAHAPVVIGDAATDPAFCGHPTPAMYGFRSYVSTPIILPAGDVFGTLCSLDRQPRDLSSPWLLNMFKLFAELIAFQIDAQQRLGQSAADLAASQRVLATSLADLNLSQSALTRSRAELASSAASLSDERAGTELREQFIAVLGHDLRNPLASIGAGAKLLAKEPLSDSGRRILALVGNSVDRMAGLINDVLDFARGRLGGGIMVEKTEQVPLAPMLRQVVSELESSHPHRRIVADFDHITTCHCDPGRIGQLLSNLVANALVHGATDAPVIVRGALDGDFIQLSVSNAGAQIPPETMASLFKPFVRASARSSQQGLGLGLYIASEIAKAHGGTLEARSTAQETVFTFRMPA
jgi:signal transduction histidine kinase